MLSCLFALLATRLAAATPVNGSGNNAWEYPSLEDWQDQPEMAQQGHALWSSLHGHDEAASSGTPSFASAHPNQPIQSVVQEQQNRSDNTEAYYNRVLADAARDPTYNGPQGLPVHMYWDLLERSRRNPGAELPLRNLLRKSDRAHRESAARLRTQRQRAPNYEQYYNEDGTQYNEDIQRFIRNLMRLHIPIDVIYEYVWAGIQDGQIDDLARYEIVCEERWNMTPIRIHEDEDGRLI